MNSNGRIEDRLEELGHAMDGSESFVDDVMSRVGTRSVNETNIRLSAWRIIMKSKMTRVAAAAMVAIGIFISLNFLDKSVTPVYGITEALNMCKNARTIYIHGWGYIPMKGGTGQEFSKAPIEYWFDLESGSYKMVKPGGVHHDTGKLRYFTTISDGQYVMSDSYTYPLEGESYKSVRFEKLTEFHSRFQARNNAYQFLVQTFGGVDKISGFVRVGDELLKGVRCKIWEGEISTPGPNGGQQIKIRSWLSLGTGELTQIQMLQKQPGSSEWIPMVEIDQIKLDAELSPDIFVTNPPEGCRLSNTKDTAPWAVLGSTNSVGLSGLILDVHVAFTLPDGSVILCWRSTDGESPSQEKLFGDLKSGGDLPKLPLEIYAIKTIANVDIEYLGYHLAYTKKDDRFFEWSIYVPEQETPARDSIVGYEVMHKYNISKKMAGLLALSVSEDIQIDNEEDFHTWVHGAMKELSDRGEIPEGVSYESVLELVENIQESMDQ